MADAPQDPLEFFKSLWGGMGFTPPGMVAPTLDVGELDKRIADLKAVEGWLKMNLNMLQMSIQGMEMQRATLSVLQTRSPSQGDAEAQPFANPAPGAPAWPWNFMQPAGGATAPVGQEQPKTTPGRKKK